MYTTIGEIVYPYNQEVEQNYLSLITYSNDTLSNEEKHLLY